MDGGALFDWDLTDEEEEEEEAVVVVVVVVAVVVVVSSTGFVTTIGGLAKPPTPPEPSTPGLGLGLLQEMRIRKDLTKKRKEVIQSEKTIKKLK